jgi:hypothetical protein
VAEEVRDSRLKAGQMRALSELEFERDAKPLFDQVFHTTNPFEEPFTSDVAARAILFPVHYIMEKPLARAIIKAAERLREHSFYVTVLERPPAAEHDRAYHWHIGFKELDDYKSLGYPFVLENAVYSDRGTWGLMFSHEHHAVLGGPKEFVHDVLKALPDAVTNREKLMEYWKDNQARFGSNLDWLPRLVDHIYSDRVSGRVLSKTDASTTARQ